jgi:hypothetical protein
VPTRAITILAVAMGVMILVGTAVLGVLIARRLSGAAELPPLAIRLGEPEGTRITGIAAVRDRLAVQLTGGGPDRVLLIDLQTGASTGQLVLGAEASPKPR